jgi:hypothetical protein
MANLRLVITQPAQRADGAPMPIAELRHVLLSMNTAQATDWTQIGGPMLPNELSRPAANVPGGPWQFRAVWVDVDGRSSAPLVVDFTVPFAAPGQGTLTISVVP